MAGNANTRLSGRGVFQVLDPLFIKFIKAGLSLQTP